MKTITDILIDLVILILVLSGRFLKAVAFVAIAMAVLWIVGHFFPNVVAELGFPCDNVYQCLQSLIEGFRGQDLFNTPAGPGL